MVISSPEKLHSHELINGVLFRWLEYHMNHGNYARVVTMPASSGRHENLIMDYVYNFNISEHWRAKRILNPNSSNLELLTFDNRIDAAGTNINPHTKGRMLWRHYKCGDIFRRMMTLGLKEAPTAAWFDMTGGLTDKNWTGMQSVVKYHFADGSLFFVTLAIDCVRGLGESNYSKRVYDSFDKRRVSKRFVTDLLLTEMVQQTGKYIKPVIDPYVYKHGRTTYGVFGYLVGKQN